MNVNLGYYRMRSESHYLKKYTSWLSGAGTQG